MLNFQGDNMFEIEDYRNWITSNKKQDGNFYDITYANNCVTSLRTLFIKLNINDINGKSSLLEVENYDEVISICNCFENRTEFIKLNKDKHYRFSNAIRFLKKYLLSKEDCRDNPLTTIVDDIKEGKKKFFYTTKYERSNALRQKAIEIHGQKCCACGFDFGEKYGELGKNYIEVHHIKPLHSLTEEVIIDPKTDLICVCSNCHRMIHKRKNKILSIDELRNIIKQTD